MKELNPDEILGKLLSEVQEEENKGYQAMDLVKNTYANLGELLFVKSYAKRVSAKKDTLFEYEKSLDILGKIIQTLMEVEEISIAEAGVKYLADMDIVLPDFAAMNASTKEDSPVDFIKQLLKLPFVDPFKNWKGTPRDTKANRETVTDILAAVGKLLVVDRLKKEPKFNQSVERILTHFKNAVGAEIYAIHHLAETAEDSFYEITVNKIDPFGH